MNQTPINNTSVSVTNFTSRMRCAAYHYESQTPCYVQYDSTLIHFNNKSYPTNNSQGIFFMKFFGDLLIVAAFEGNLLFYRKKEQNLEHICFNQFSNIINIEAVRVDHKIYIAILWAFNSKLYYLCPAIFKDDKLIYCKEQQQNLHQQIPPAFVFAPLNPQQMTLKFIKIIEAQPVSKMVLVTVLITENNQNDVEKHHELKLSTRIPEHITFIEKNILVLILNSHICFIKIEETPQNCVYQLVEFPVFKRQKMKIQRVVSLGGVTFFVDQQSIYCVSNEVIKGSLVSVKDKENIALDSISCQKVVLEKFIFACDFSLFQTQIMGQIFTADE